MIRVPRLVVSPEAPPIQRPNSIQLRTLESAQQPGQSGGELGSHIGDLLGESGTDGVLDRREEHR